MWWLGPLSPHSPAAAAADADDAAAAEADAESAPPAAPAALSPGPPSCLVTQTTETKANDDFSGPLLPFLFALPSRFLLGFRKSLVLSVR